MYLRENSTYVIFSGSLEHTVTNVKIIDCFFYIHFYFSVSISVYEETKI